MCDNTVLRFIEYVSGVGVTTVIALPKVQTIGKEELVLKFKFLHMYNVDCSFSRILRLRRIYADVVRVHLKF